MTQNIKLNGPDLNLCENLQALKWLLIQCPHVTCRGKDKLIHVYSRPVTAVKGASTKLKRVKDAINYFVYICTLSWTIYRCIIMLTSTTFPLSNKKKMLWFSVKKIKGDKFQLWWMHLIAKLWICVPSSKHKLLQQKG